MLPGEPVAHDHVGVAAVDVARLDVADKVPALTAGVGRLEQLVGLARELVALALFLADRQEPDARRLDPEGDAGVDAAHGRKLQEMRGPALHGRPDIEEHGRPLPRRDGRREGRPIDAVDHPERGVGRHHGGAGVSRAEQRRRLPAGHDVSRHPDRRPRLPPERGSGRLRHPDDIAGLDEAHSVRVVMHPGELGRQPVSRTDEHHTKIEMTGRRQRARDDGPRRKVAAEGVDRDPDHSSLTARA